MRANQGPGDITGVDVMVLELAHLPRLDDKMVANLVSISKEFLLKNQLK